MRSRGGFALAALIVTGVAIGPAAAARRSAPYPACLQKAQTTYEMDQCVGAEYRRLDAKLNALYRRVRAAAGRQPAVDKALVEAERAWIAFRDADCAVAEAPYAGGTIAPVYRTMCLIDRETTRVAELRAFLQTFTHH